MSRTAVLVFIRGRFERAYPLASDRAHSFEDGVSVGAGCFGGDDLFTALYPMPVDHHRVADLQENVPDVAEQDAGRYAGQRAIETGMSRGREASLNGRPADGT